VRPIGTDRQQIDRQTARSQALDQIQHHPLHATRT